MLLQIVYSGRRRILVDSEIEETLIDQNKTIGSIEKDKTSIVIENLVAKTEYTFSIAAMFNDDWGPVKHLTVETNGDRKWRVF